MLLPSLGSGFTSARRHLRLAIVFWLASLLLALPTTVAFFAWWSNALQYTPGADVLLGRMDLGVLIDMVEEGQVGAWNLLFAALLTTALVALVVNAFLAGGVLELLVAARAQRHSHEPREPRSFSHRFFRGAGHFFWRSLALLVLTLIAAGAVVAAVSAGLRFALKPFETSLSIVVSWATLLAPLLVTGLVVVFFCVFVLDYARIDLVRSDRRNPFPLWWRGLMLALERFWTTLGIWIVIGILLALLVVVYVAVRGAIGQHTVGLVVTAFLAQQLGLIAGAWLRIAGLGAEVEVAGRARPDPPPAPVPEPIEERRVAHTTPATEAQPPAEPGPLDVG
jgi:hypothetical protein